MCDPTGGWLIGSAVLGIAQAYTGYQAAQEQTRIANANAQQQYEFQVLQASSQRNYESNRQQLQDDFREQNEWLARNAFESQNAQLNLRIQQEQLLASQQKKEAAKKALQLKGEVVAAGRVGNTIDNLIADVYRQQASFDFATGQNLAFASRQAQEEKRGLRSQMAGRIASAQPYLQRTILDPVKPIMRSSPSALPFVLQGLGSVAQAGAAGASYDLQKAALKSKQPSTLDLVSHYSKP